MAAAPSLMQDRLQRAASLFFDRLAPPIRLQLVQTFRSMDANGDGRISLTELIRWARTTAAAHSSSSSTCTMNNPTSTTSAFEAAMPVIFAFVDADRNKTLDFEECKGLFFIGCTASRTCDGCGKLLLESAYTCADCSSMHEHSAAANTFDLCTSCYAAFMRPVRPNFLAARNPKLNHPHRHMVEQHSELADAMDDLFDQVQCSICKEYHRSTARGLLINRHVIIGTGPRDFTACEWCIASLCSSCGNHFQGSQQNASSGRWAIRGSSTCTPCRQQRSRGLGFSSQSTPAFPQNILMKMEKTKLFEECSTCKAKAKNGSLFSSILPSTSTPQGGTFGNASPHSAPRRDAFPMASPHSTPRSGPFGHAYPPNRNMPNMFGHAPYVRPYMHPYHAMGPTHYTPNFNPTTPFGGGGYGNNINSFADMAGSFFNNGVGWGGGSSFDVLNVTNSMGSSPLDMLNMVTSMGNPLDMLSLVSMCSIM